ncbi:MAG: hypothetical protein ABW022_27130, partial [Actinoplanes sp.]
MTTVIEHDTREQPTPATSPRPEAASRRTFRSRMPAVRTFLVTLLLLSGTTAGGTYVVTHRLAETAFVLLDEAVLTAEALPVGSTAAGVVTDLLVTGQSRVAAGQELARVRHTTDP